MIRAQPNYSEAYCLYEAVYPPAVFMLAEKFHANTADGTLGIPYIFSLVPRLRRTRLVKMTESEVM